MPTEDSPTPWYQFALPNDNDLMSDPKTYITDNFTKIINASKPAVIADGGPLPQTGYNVGDRVYMGGVTQSIFICVTNDPFWGLWWKPIQAVIAPWRTVPTTAIEHVDWQQHPTSPFAMTLDNKGRLICRGAVQIKSTPTIPNNSSFQIFRDWPDGLRPPASGMFPCVVDPIVMTNPTGLGAMKAGRLLIRADGTNSSRFWNTSPSGPKTTDVWLTEVQYAVGRNDYITA